MSAVRPLSEHFLSLISTLDSKTNEYFIESLLLFIIYGDVFKKEKKQVKVNFFNVSKNITFFFILLFRHIQDIEIYIESFGPEFGTNQLLKP